MDRNTPKDLRGEDSPKSPDRAYDTSGDKANASVSKPSPAASPDGGRDYSDHMSDQNATIKKADAENQPGQKNQQNDSGGTKAGESEKRTSHQSQTENKSDSEQSKNNQGKSDAKQFNKNVAVANSALQASMTASKLAAFFKLFLLLKLMTQAVQALAQNFWHILGSTIKSVMKSVTNFAANAVHAVGAACASVGAFLGVSTVVVSTSAAGFIIAIIFAIISIFGSISIMDHVASDGVNNKKCKETVAAVAEPGANGPLDEMTLKNAKAVYSVMHEWGMPDINIAGILGNFASESGIDPTCVETIYTEPFTMGPRKLQAQSVGFDIDIMDPAYGARFPAITRCGIGLGQWTDTNGSVGEHTYLLQFAKAVNKNWYELDTQLTFMLTPRDRGGDDNFPILERYKNTVLSSPEAAAIEFAHKWERNTVLAQEERQHRAAEWYVQLQTWQSDTTYAHSVISMAGAVQASATDGATASALNDCRSAATFDNTSLASAAVSYAWPTTAQGIGNNGTELYQSVLQAVAPGDPYYMSCDRTVATAVRWAGCDDTYPMGDVDLQLVYLMQSDKWSEVTDWDGNPLHLQPGDVMIQPDGEHTVMYVGHEAIVAKYPENTDPLFCVVSGSYMERSPGCEKWYSGSSQNCLNNYRIFRNVKKEPNSKFKDVATSASQKNNN